MRLEDLTEDSGVPLVPFTAILSPADHFAAQSDLIESRRTGTSHGEYARSATASLSAKRSIRVPARRRGRASANHGLDRHFGPVPESEFEPEQLVEGRWIEKAADPDENYRDPESFAYWYGVPVFAGQVSLLVGTTTGLFLKWLADHVTNQPECSETVSPGRMNCGGVSPVWLSWVPYHVIGNEPKGDD